jgi:hypothetical protein
MISGGDKMGRESGVERVFAEQLDKMLAGQPVQIAADMEDDLRTALDFSQRMLALRPDPRLQFQTVLKVNLIQQLKEKEARQSSSRPWFWKVLPREPIWQAAVVVAIMIVVGGVLWSTLFRTGAPPVANVPAVPPATSAAPAPAGSAAPAPMTSAAPAPPAAASPAPAAAGANRYLAAQGSVDKAVYNTGEPVKIVVSWKNLTSQNLTVQEFPPIVSLMETADALPVYTFAAGKSSRTLTPGESAAYTFTWDQRDARGNLVSPGRYYVELEEMYYKGQSVKMDLASPVSFNITIK